MLAALGPSGVGKTVYLGMLLDMLSRQSSGVQLSAHGSFPVTLQQMTMAASDTANFRRRHPARPIAGIGCTASCTAPKHRKPADFVLPDIAGEALFGEVDRPRSYQLIHWLLGRCDGVFVLIDGTKLQSGSIDEDFFTMKLLSHLSELHSIQKVPGARGPWP